jgi:exonuclease SbcD
MVLGATLTGSERAGQSVFEYSISANAFPPNLQYVALGHLHRQQPVPGPVPVHYSGSPLQLDFGEVKDDKGVLLVEVHPGMPATVTAIDVTKGRRLRVVEGTVADLAALDVGDEWVKAIVTEKLRPGLADEVRALIPNAVDVLVASTTPQPHHHERSPRTGRSPQELFAEFLDQRDVDGTELTPMFAELLDATMESQS